MDSVERAWHPGWLGTLAEVIGDGVAIFLLRRLTLLLVNLEFSSMKIPRILEQERNNFSFYPVVFNLFSVTPSVSNCPLFQVIPPFE